MSYKFPSEAFINPHPIPFPSHMQASEFSTPALECGPFTDRLFALGHITQYFWLTNFFTGNWEGVLRASHVDRWIKRFAYVSATASGTQWAEREIPIVFLFLCKACPWRITSLDLKCSSFLCCQAQGESHKYAFIIYPKPLLSLAILRLWVPLAGMLGFLFGSQGSRDN